MTSEWVIHCRHFPWGMAQDFSVDFSTSLYLFLWPPRVRQPLFHLSVSLSLEKFPPILGRASSSWMIGCCVTSSSAANKMVDGQFSTSLKCSTHCLRILLRSVMRVVPSALTSGVVPLDWSPCTVLRPS